MNNVDADQWSAQNQWGAQTAWDWSGTWWPAWSEGSLSYAGGGAQYDQYGYFSGAQQAPTEATPGLCVLYEDDAEKPSDGWCVSVKHVKCLRKRQKRNPAATPTATSESDHCGAVAGSIFRSSPLGDVASSFFGK